VDRGEGVRSPSVGADGKKDKDMGAKREGRPASGVFYTIEKRSGYIYGVMDLRRTI